MSEVSSRSSASASPMCASRSGRGARADERRGSWWSASNRSWSTGGPDLVLVPRRALTQPSPPPWWPPAGDPIGHIEAACVRSTGRCPRRSTASSPISRRSALHPSPEAIDHLRAEGRDPGRRLRGRQHYDLTRARRAAPLVRARRRETRARARARHLPARDAAPPPAPRRRPTTHGDYRRAGRARRCAGLTSCSRSIPTRARIESVGSTWARSSSPSRWATRSFVGLVARSRAVLTDSGAASGGDAYLGSRASLRDNTERVTCTMVTNCCSACGQTASSICPTCWQPGPRRRAACPTLGRPRGRAHRADPPRASGLPALRVPGRVSGLRTARPKRTRCAPWPAARVARTPAGRLKDPRRRVSGARRRPAGRRPQP
jgi:hypothetical protein